MNWATAMHAEGLQLSIDTQPNKPQQLENENQVFVVTVTFLWANLDGGV